MSRFERGQTQVLYRYLPGAIFEHDDYDLCIVEQVILEEPDRINREALFNALVEALQEWHRRGIPPEFPDPRDDRMRRQYRIGRPREVIFKPFPITFQCQRCGHVFRQQSQDSRYFNGRCPRRGCDGRLKQIRYVEVHNCGRIEEIYLPQKGCPEHGKTHLRFYNPGRVRLARWICGICGREIQKPRMTPCNCGYTKFLKETGDINRSRFDQYLRLYPTGEPGLYIPHITAFVNFDQEEEKKFSRIEGIHAFLLARWWGILDQPVNAILQEREKTIPEQKGKLKELLDALRQTDPNHPLIKKYERNLSNLPGEEVLEQIKRLVRDDFLNLPPPRRLVEHIILKDSNRHQRTTIEDLFRRRKTYEEAEQANHFKQNLLQILKKLGILEITHIDNFPIALLAFGYTRITRDPQRSILNPFPADDKGRIPLFVLPTETEGLWFQLDPYRVVHWLIQNNLLSGHCPTNPLEARAYLYERVLATGFRSDRDFSLPAWGIICLLHTISHILLQHIEWSGFSPQSLGEYLLPETLSFVLFVNRYDGSRIGGLGTLFELRLTEWLQESLQDGRHCIYDPLCAEGGGSCAGCLHREHNCTFFNGYLSRSILYGGVVPTEDSFGLIKIQHGYWLLDE